MAKETPKEEQVTEYKIKKYLILIFNRFNLEALEKHVKICKNVFQGKRKQYPMSYYRNKELMKFKTGNKKSEVINL